jgi:membrane carboxypeptidase/penicillin-binding protein
MSRPSSTVRISQRRREQRSSAGQSLAARLGRAGIALAAILSLALALGAIWAGYIYSQVSAELPNPALLESLLNGPGQQLGQPTRLLANDGETVILTLQNPNAASVEYLRLDELPYFLLDAVLAAQDPEFWDHGGYQIGSLDPETHNTLAQILAYELLLYTEEPSLTRALRERLLAAQATHTFGQADILEWYLNSADFGQLAFGVDAAAHVYFGKSAAEINLAEAAMLAAIAQSPDLNPIDTPDLALQKQSRVLQAMVNQHYLTETEALASFDTPLSILPAADAPHSLAPDFTRYALTQATAQFSRQRVERGGLLIVTTLDLALQSQVDCIAKVQLARLRGELSLNSLSGIDCDGARLLPNLTSELARAEGGIAAHVAVLDPTTGAVLALRGDPRVNLPPGSSLSPFVYLTAFTRGLSPASLLWDIPASLPAPVADYSNPDGDYLGPLRLRAALANDRVVAALHTLAQVGPANAWRTLRQSGLETFNPPDTGTASYLPLLEDNGVSLVELAQAYSVFSNNGFLSGRATADESFEAASLTLIRTADQRILLDWAASDQRAVTSAQLAFLITDVLADPVARRLTWGANNPLEVNRPAAGLLAQSYDGQSTWAIGYSPQRVIAVWLGYPVEAQSSLSPLAAGGIWQAIFSSAHADLPLVNFPQPVGLVERVVCAPSGLLPTAGCPELVQELFIPGNEPVQLDNLFQTFLVNQQTGRLATIFTPEEYVEERVYMVVPPEAQDWARGAGVETPPEDYDVVFNPGVATQTVAITSPEIFSYVSGTVPIAGRTVVDGFSFYRLQVGEGLYPRQWLQIGTDNETQVVNDQLGVWDTSGLNGLYAVQLLVVGQDQSVERFSIQVTVDNQPPAIDVLIPTPGQRFSFPQEADITFQAEVSDNLGLARVEFIVDGERTASLSQGPYVSPWSGSIGEHTLVVRATDRAGNIQEISITFIIER